MEKSCLETTWPLPVGYYTGIGFPRRKPPNYRFKSRPISLSPTGRKSCVVKGSWTVRLIWFLLCTQHRGGLTKWFHCEKTKLLIHLKICHLSTSIPIKCLDSQMIFEAKKIRKPARVILKLLCVPCSVCMCITLAFNKIVHQLKSCFHNSQGLPSTVYSKRLDLISKAEKMLTSRTTT